MVTWPPKRWARSFIPASPVQPMSRNSAKSAWWPESQHRLGDGQQQLLVCPA